ncbi:MAG: hypothetical protein HY331_10165 [Chloroflexi bacterium]|nr:hypothetical protein [Chloroflexota bacterium]
MLTELIGRILLNHSGSELERYYGSMLLERRNGEGPRFDEAKRDLLTFVELNARVG